MSRRSLGSALLAALALFPAIAGSQQSVGTRAGRAPLRATVPADTADSATAAVPRRADSARTRPDSAPAAPAPKPAAGPALIPGVGTIRMNGLLQAWYVTGSGAAHRTFRLRRAELKLSGDIAPRVGWTLGIDAAKALAVTPTYVTVDGQRVLADESVNLASQMLQDASVTVRIPHGVAIDVGQVKVPLSLTGTQSAARLETVERPMFIVDRARGAGYGDVRDVGVQLRGTTARHLDWWMGAFNGSGESQNGTDRNDQKAVAARLVVRGGLPGLQLGASGVSGGHATADNARRDRLGVEAQYASGPFTVRSELMTGVDGGTHRAGSYAHLGYRARRGVELVTRFDSWDPDTKRESSLATARARELLGGVNIALGATSTLLQLDYADRSYGGAAPRVHQLLMNLQTAW